MTTAPVTPRDLADHLLHIHKGDVKVAYAECLALAKAHAGTTVGVLDGKACAILSGMAMKAGIAL